MNAKKAKKLRKEVRDKMITSELKGKQGEKDAYYGNQNNWRATFRARKKNEGLKKQYGLDFSNADINSFVPAGKTVTPKGFRKSVFDVPDNLRVTKPKI